MKHTRVIPVDDTVVQAAVVEFLQDKAYSVEEAFHLRATVLYQDDALRTRFQRMNTSFGAYTTGTGDLIGIKTVFDTPWGQVRHVRLERLDAVLMALDGSIRLIAHEIANVSAQVSFNHTQYFNSLVAGIDLYLRSIGWKE